MACSYRCKLLYLVKSARLPNRTPIVFSSTVNTPSDETHTIGNQLYNEEENDAEFGPKRDISRLPSHLANKMNHRFQLTEDETNILHPNREARVTYDRQLYAKYGKASGVTPGIMWPSKEELMETIKDEKEWDKTLSEMRSSIEQKKATSLKAMMEKDQLVEQRMKEMPKHIEKYRQTLRDIKKEEERGRQRQNKLLEEAREFFGYDISPKDAQFKAYEENKKEEETKLFKKLKKEKKAAMRKEMHAITGEAKSTEEKTEQISQ